MAWDYSELSKAAKVAGGPEKLMNQLIAYGKDTGHKEMLPLVGVALVIGALGYAGITKLIEYFKMKRMVSLEAVEEAKAELIKGIEAYDAAHTEEEDTNIVAQEGRTAQDE